MMLVSQLRFIMTEVTSAIAEGLEERKADKADKQDSKEEAPAAKTSTKEEAPKEVKKEAKESAKPDDLTKIEGIGPKAAEALVAASIASFADLAKADTENVKTILTDASSRLAHLDPTSWAKQAQMAADGKWDELKAWQDSIVGGQRRL